MKKYCFLLVFLLALNFAQAQPAMPKDPNPTPIDGGISLLIGSAVALGVAKHRQFSQKEK